MQAMLVAARKYDDELVLRPSGRRIRRPAGRTQQALGHRHHHPRIAGPVAMRVVEFLEPVDVDQAEPVAAPSLSDICPASANAATAPRRLSTPHIGGRDRRCSPSCCVRSRTASSSSSRFSFTG